VMKASASRDWRMTSCSFWFSDAAICSIWTWQDSTSSMGVSYWGLWGWDFHGFPQGQRVLWKMSHHLYALLSRSLLIADKLDKDDDDEMLVE
jgi:hypothetical protein